MLSPPINTLVTLPADVPPADEEPDVPPDASTDATGDPTTDTGEEPAGSGSGRSCSLAR